MEFAAFAERVNAIESEPADLETIGLVAELLRQAGADLAIVTRYLQGRVFPAHDRTKLNVGPTLCYEALAKAAGPNISAEDIESRLAAVGEIGTVAEELELGGQRGLSSFSTNTDSLTVPEVDDTLRAVADAKGSGSTNEKRDRLFGLFNRTDPLGARYLARLVLGDMRIGVGEGTIRDAIAEAFEIPVEAVERAIQVSNDCGLVAECAREEGVDGVESISLRVGRPIRAMLAQAGTANDALETWDEAAVETKFDGARVQVHHENGDVRLFSRNLEEVTDALPEVVGTVAGTLDVPAILDAEVVAIDEDGTPRPFQAILRRFQRKHDIEAVRGDVEIELRAFDCLYADGEELLGSPFRDRRERLEELLDNSCTPVTYVSETETVADIEAEALAVGHEGVMLKNPEAAYTPGSRGQNWLKRKPEVETLDLVVTGAEWGEGRRANLLGTFLVSVRTNDGFEPVGKVATGITDERLESLHDLLWPHVYSEVGTELDIEPAVVFEVGYEEIQRSPTYGSGYALRFPRFVGVRTDKSPEDVDTLERLERLAEQR